MNTLVHEVTRIDCIAVEDAEQLAEAIRFFGTDLPLDRTMIIELLSEKLSDGSEVSTLRLRPAESAA